MVRSVAVVLLAHAGNRIDDDDRTEPRFSPEQVGPVTVMVGKVLADLGPSGVVSAPANGADLIVLGEAQRLGINTHIVLPLPAEEFQERSVEASDTRWVERYRVALDRASTTTGSSVEVTDLSADPEWYLAAQRLILDRARAVAGRDETIVALTVRPAHGETPPSATDDFARQASEAGLKVITIDPRPGRTAG